MNTNRSTKIRTFIVNKVCGANIEIVKSLFRKELKKTSDVNCSLGELIRNNFFSASHPGFVLQYDEKSQNRFKFTLVAKGSNHCQFILSLSDINLIIDLMQEYFNFTHNKEVRIFLLESGDDYQKSIEILDKIQSIIQEMYSKSLK